jgi:hypothetical protein
MTEEDIKKELSLYLKDEGYILLLQGLRKAVTSILSNNILPHFTDHSVEHSDRLVEIINKLISPIPEHKKLSNQELLILFASCYLHDIGMQYENAGNTQTIAKLNLKQRWEELKESTRRDYLRTHHHEISAEFVMMLGPDHDSSIGYKLPSDIKPGYIAALCEAHCVPTENPRYQELLDTVPGIRMPLLSALLRVADILDESCRRIIIDKANTLLLDNESQKHWWRHYYTEDISFNTSKMEITFYFDFPQAKREEYKAIIPNLQLPWVRSEFSNHNDVFNEAQLNWSLKWALTKKAYSSAKSMPEDVLAEMLKELHLRNTKEAEEKQIMALNSFAESRPYIQRRIDDLRKNKESKEYLLDLWLLAKNMKEIGGVRSAWNILRFEFSENLQSLPKAKQIEIGTWLAETILEDGFVNDALNIINKIGGLADELEDIGLLRSFLKIKLKAMISGFYWDEANKTFISLYQKTFDSFEKQKISADMHEWAFLSGESFNINDLLSDKESRQC